MPLQLLLLQIPLWNGEPDLTDYDWRDRNIDTLPFWHPCFFEVLPESVDFLYQYFLISRKYKNILLECCPNEPYEELLEHVKQEAEMWILNAMNEISYFVWRDENGKLPWEK